MKDVLSRIFLIFIFYSFVGFLYEIAYETFLEHWIFMPREFFRGPICPIYGIGGVILFLIFTPIMENRKLFVLLKLIIVFVVTFVVSSIIEFISSYILEYFTGGWPWQSYANYDFNFGGRISLPTSIKFGFIGVIFIFFMYNKINDFLNKLKSKNMLVKVGLVFLILFLCDVIFAVLIPTGVMLNVERIRFY